MADINKTIPWVLVKNPKGKNIKQTEAEYKVCQVGDEEGEDEYAFTDNSIFNNACYYPQAPSIEEAALIVQAVNNIGVTKNLLEKANDLASLGLNYINNRHNQEIGRKELLEFKKEVQNLLTKLEEKLI